MDGANSGARFNEPARLALASDGTLYVADSLNHTIRKVSRAGTTWNVTTLAGTPGVPGSSDGTNSSAQFNYPYGIALGSSSVLYVADTYNHTIREVVLAGADAIVTTLAGTAGAYGTSDGRGSAARFYYPYGVAVGPSGDVYVADSYNHTIRRVTAAGEVTTIAGLAGAAGIADGTNSFARFYYPSGIAVDGAGGLFLADTYNSTVRRITQLGSDWVTITLAGLPRFSGSADGTNRFAQFDYPFGIVASSAGGLYVADTLNHTVRALAPAGTNWVVTTIAGSAGEPGTSDGPGSVARFRMPYGVAIDSAGNLFVADTYNHTIRFGQPGIKLQAALSASQLVLSWPLAASNYVLETSSSLSPGAPWASLTSGIVVSGGLYFRTNSTSASAAFFRLHLQ